MTVRLVLDSVNAFGDRLSTFVIEGLDEEKSATRLVRHRMLSTTRVGIGRYLVSATEWEHFFAVEIQPRSPIEDLALRIRTRLEESAPRRLRDADWHLPFVNLEDAADPGFVEERYRDRVLQISVARCAEGSFRYEKPAHDVALHDAFVARGRFSPFEHVAQALAGPKRCGNFIGWKQYRKFFADEYKGRRIEVVPSSDTGYSPLYVRMEIAFKEELLAHVDGSEIARQKLREFFPREAEKRGI